jgi:hypothetical protein
VSENWKDGSFERDIFPEIDHVYLKKIKSFVLILKRCTCLAEKVKNKNSFVSKNFANSKYYFSQYNFFWIILSLRHM